ncbi:MAG: glucuronate isomerase [Clostridiales bacterium]|jgi:glucuronate isomerase|nr:glucuronate isomerase [Clostridiales bacterium]
MSAFIENSILKSASAKKIFDEIKTLPIIDYHCHLNAKDIYEDKPFSDISDVWLKGDHYKWRLMRQAGIDERLITGDADGGEKFAAFASAAERAFGNPVRDFCRLELSAYFGIDEQLTIDNAAEIRAAANAAIARQGLSPRKLIARSGVEYIATTDNPFDSLEYHAALKSEGFLTGVAPTFRVDSLFNIANAEQFRRDAQRLAESSSVEIDGFDGFLEAIERRARDFSEAGCRFADIGIEGFPSSVGEYSVARWIFNRVFGGGSIERGGADAYVGYMYVWWLRLCKKYGFTAQLHIGAMRNANRRAFALKGADCGFDTVADGFSASALKDVLNAADGGAGLPQIIVYTLNPIMYYPLFTLCGAFKGVSVGAPWWFNDHKRGIIDYFDRASELSHIGRIPGMLTDSRSFMSYVRHGYFRMLAAEYLSRFKGEKIDALIKTARDISYFNMKKIISGGGIEA